MVESSLQMLSISCIAELASYEIGSLSAPYQDTLLTELDQSLGLDWIALAQLVAKHEWLSGVLRFAYQSFAWQPFAVIAVLSLSGAHRRLQLFMLGWVLALVITLPGLAIAPAQTPWVHFGSDGPIPDLAAQVGQAQSITLEALRAGKMRNLLSDPFEGIVAFPSFHTAGALLYLWAVWEIIWLRWGAVLLNVLMIIATPVIGAHYFVDVIAGAVVAIAALLSARGIMRALDTPLREVPAAHVSRPDRKVAQGVGG
jgi:membrane-associated phospholipid phosphatase